MSHTIGQIKKNNRQLNNSSQVDRDSLKPEERTRSSMPISDIDYEFLFNQLLEGIAHGWHERRIVKFFVRLGDRAEQKDWVAWLERLRDKASALPPQSKRQLGAMMIRLGELTCSTTEVDKISSASHRIGKELLFGNIEVREYDGSDISLEGDRQGQELAERLPTNFNTISSDGETEETESPRYTAETAESLSNSDQERSSKESATSLWEYVGPDLSLEAKSELAERLPTNFNTISSDGETEETESPRYTAETAESLSNSDQERSSKESATSLWEYVGPDLSLKAKSELAEQLPTDFDAVSSEKVVEKTEESPRSITEAAAESRSNSDQERSQRVSELPTSKSAIPDKLEADLVDPQSIPQTKQTTPNTIFSESELGLSSSKQQEEFKEIESLSNSTSIIDNLQDSDIEDIAESIHTSEIEAFDIDRVMDLIQEDEELARQISQKLNRAIAKPNAVPLDRSSLELIESWFNLGLKQVSVGKFANAIASWENALNINPNLPEAWHNRGSALGRLGDYEAAIESFENALAIDPENDRAWNDRAHALYQLQNWKGAADSWSNAIKIMPGNHLFWYNRACALEHLEKWDEAIASHEKALEIVPDFEPGRLRYINLIADSSRSN